VIVSPGFDFDFSVLALVILTFVLATAYCEIEYIYEFW